MFKRLSIFALTLVLTLGLLVVPALAGENGCTHECTVENGCAKIEWTCTKEEHTHTDECFIFQNGVAIAIRCPKDAHTHIDGKCYITVYGDCKHVHDADCGYVAPEPEQPAAEGPAAEGGEKSRRTILYRMEYSYSAKLYQSSPEQKDFYSTIVQEVRSFPKVKRAVSWRQERIYAGRNKLALLVFRGKRLCIALALDPDEWEETKYHGLDVGEIKRYEKTPMMLRITSARKAKYACELLRIAAERAGLVRQEAPAEELDLPYRTTEELLDVGLIRMIANGRGGENDVYERRPSAP